MAAQKITPTVFLGINGVILINWLTPGEKFNSGYFYEKVLEQLSDILQGGCAARSPRPIMHFDNATSSINRN
jgi:hypothetical protein